MEKQQKELNLSELLMHLFKGIGNILKCLWRVFIQALRLSYQKKWILLGFILVGLLWGFLVSTPDKHIHKGAITINTIIKGSQYSKEFIKTLNAECGKKDKSDFAEKMNLSLEDAKKIIALKSFYIVDVGDDDILDQVDFKDNFKGDSINTWSKNHLYVEMLSTDEKLFPAIRDGIIFALNNDVSVQKEKVFMEHLHSNWVAMLEDDLTKINDLQTHLYTESTTSVTLQQKSKEKRTDPNIMTVLGETKMQLFTEDKIASMSTMNSHKRLMKELTEGPIRVDLPVLYLGVINPRHKTMLTRAFLAYLLGLGVCAFLVNRKRILAFLEA